MTAPPGGLITRFHTKRAFHEKAAKAVPYLVEIVYVKKMSGEFYQAERCWVVLPNDDQPVVRKVRNHNFLDNIPKNWTTVDGQTPTR